MGGSWSGRGIFQWPGDSPWEVWGLQPLVQPLWKAVWKCPKKLKMDLSFDPMLLLLGTYPKVPQSTNCKEHKHLYVHCSVIYNHQDLEATQVSINRWADKTTMGYFHTRILFGCKKEENFTFHNSMDGPREHYAKWNKPVRERQIPYDFTHMWNLMNKLIKENGDRLTEGK